MNIGRQSGKITLSLWDIPRRLTRIFGMRRKAAPAALSLSHDYKFVVVIMDRGGQPCGMGVLVDRDAVITCAHVAKEALGLQGPLYEQPAPTAQIALRFPFTKETPRKAVIQEWQAPGAPVDHSDLCLLRLTTPVSEKTQAAKLIEAKSGSEFQACRFIESALQLEWAHGSVSIAAANGSYQVVATAGKSFIAKGFSGGPAICARTGDVLGIVMRVNPKGNSGHIKASQAVARFCSLELGNSDDRVEDRDDGEQARPIKWSFLVAASLLTVIAGAAFYFQHVKMRVLICRSEYHPRIAENRMALSIYKQSDYEAIKRQGALHRVRVMLLSLGHKVTLKPDSQLSDLHVEIFSMLSELTEEIKEVKDKIRSAEADEKANARNLRDCEEGR